MADYGTTFSQSWFTANTVDRDVALTEGNKPPCEPIRFLSLAADARGHCAAEEERLGTLR